MLIAQCIVSYSIELVYWFAHFVSFKYVHLSPNTWMYHQFGAMIVLFGWRKKNGIEWNSIDRTLKEPRCVEFHTRAWYVNCSQRHISRRFLSFAMNNAPKVFTFIMIYIQLLKFNLEEISTHSPFCSLSKQLPHSIAVSSFIFQNFSFIEKKLGSMRARKQECHSRHWS